ncbi:hypothetical protein M0R19_00275 [Candidatus Pacearchaeota archaeon]|nr:hypothetical protein [Candidatus Pacearchaeota archaeon]
MPDENCKYYKLIKGKKYCITSCRCSEREPGDGELIELFPCVSNNYNKCEYFLQENRFNFNK